MRVGASNTGMACVCSGQSSRCPSAGTQPLSLGSVRSGSGHAISAPDRFESWDDHDLAGTSAPVGATIQQGFDSTQLILPSVRGRDRSGWKSGESLSP